MSTAFNRASVGHSMRLFSAPQPQRLRASWEAFEILCDAESDRIGDAELLMHATKEGLKPQPVVAADVYEALRAAHALRLEHEGPDSPSNRGSAIGSPRGQIPADRIAKAITRFEAAFLR